jgi:hypothetical protein
MMISRGKIKEMWIKLNSSSTSSTMTHGTEKYNISECGILGWTEEGRSDGRLEKNCIMRSFITCTADHSGLAV